MEQGVYFQDPTSTYIDSDVTIASGTKVLCKHSFNWYQLVSMLTV